MRIPGSISGFLWHSAWACTTSWTPTAAYRRRTTSARGTNDGCIYSASPSGLTFRQAGSNHLLALTPEDPQNGQFR